MRRALIFLLLSLGMGFLAVAQPQPKRSELMAALKGQYVLSESWKSHHMHYGAALFYNHQLGNSTWYLNIGASVAASKQTYERDTLPPPFAETHSTGSVLAQLQLGATYCLPIAKGYWQFSGGGSFLYADYKAYSGGQVSYNLPFRGAYLRSTLVLGSADFAIGPFAELQVYPTLHREGNRLNATSVALGLVLGYPR